MNQYIKPTLSLLSVATNTRSTSSCATGTVEAKEIISVFTDMGIDANQLFGATESCAFEIENYCKFTGAVQVFYS